MIHLRKSSIQTFLRRSCLEWREDASNNTNKYLRNRVRNELVPLLQDIVGGPQHLEQRLRNLEEQSREIRHDLQDRAAQYLKTHITHDGDRFLLPPTNSKRKNNSNNNNARQQFDLAAKEALHMWLVEQSGSQSFPYEQLQRLLHQIQEKPHRLQWRLNMGDGWDVQREGESLRLLRTEDDGASRKQLKQQQLERDADDEPSVAELRWLPVADFPDDNGPREDAIIVRLPANAAPNSLRFFHTTVGDSKFRITPSWRPGKSPVKMSSFLRGQNVPLHLRKEAPIIVAATEQEGCESMSLVAVYVSNKHEWMVDAAFADGIGGDGTDDTTSGNNDKTGTTNRIALLL